MEAVGQKERLIPEAEYQELKEAFMESKTARDEDEYEEKESRLEEATRKIIGGDNERLLELYERLCQDAIAELRDVLNSPYWQEIFRRIIESNGVVAGATFEGMEKDKTSGRRLMNAGHVIQSLGFDRPAGALTKSPLEEPFEKIDVDDPQWQLKLKVAENFVHSFNYLIDIHSFSFIPDISRSHKFAGLLSQAKAFKYICKLLDSYGREIAGEEIRENVDLGEVLEGIHMLYDARFLGGTRSETLQEKGMPVEVITRGNVILRNADMGGIIGAIKEPATNTNRPGKVEKVELERLAKEGKPYLTILTEEVEVRGQRCVKVEIIDRGAQIDLNRIRDKIDMGDFEFRNAKVGDLFDYLSRRHLSVPLKNGAFISSGIGLHTTRETLLKYGGEIYYTNMKKHGVRCMILIPVDGGESGVKLSELGISGTELDAIAARIDEEGNVMTA